jgi:outer membrane usher protein
MLSFRNGPAIALLSVAILFRITCLWAQDDRAILTLSVNQVQKGTLIVRLRPPDVLMLVSDLEQVGLRNFSGLRETIEGETYVSLASLAPGIAYELDETAVALRLTAQPAFLAETVLELRPPRPPDITYPRETSGFFNYSLAMQEFDRVSLSSEAGFSLRGNLLFNSFTRNSDGSVLRGSTNLTLDNRNHLRRWVIGDSFAAAGGLGGAVQLAGISLSRDFGLDPYYIRQPTPTLTGTTAFPSELEVYVNDTLVRRESLPPGPFELRNLPVVAGKGSVRLLLRDSFGNVQEITTPYYFAPQILSQGVSEYNYHFGLRRNQSGRTNWSYGPLAFLGQHRYGFKDSLTAGVRLEAGPALVSGGPTVTTRLLFGELELSAAASRARGTNGAAASLVYSYLGRPVSFSSSVRMFSPRYANLTLEPSTDRARLQVNASASFSAGPRTSFTLQYATSDFRDRGLENRVSLLSSFRLMRNASLIVTGSHSHQSGQSARNELFVALNYYLGNNHTLNLSHGERPDGRSNSIELQKSLPVGPGVGYRVRADGGQQERLSGLVQYNGPFGRYEAEFDRTAGNTSNTLRLSGGLVALGGGLHITRPVQDAFALIRLPRVANVRGYASNQEIGRTDQEGELLIPNLLSYYGNSIRIDAEDLPLNYSIAGTERLIAPTFRGGTVVQFPVQRIQSLVGALVVENIFGESVVPANGQLTVSAGGTQFISPLGGQGEFYLENVPTGRHSAVVEFGEGTCQFLLEVPDADQPFVDLGTLNCSIPF